MKIIIETGDIHNIMSTTMITKEHSSKSEELYTNSHKNDIAYQLCIILKQWLNQII